jgi:hypothetical protein
MKHDLKNELAKEDMIGKFIGGSAKTKQKQYFAV